MRGIDGEEVKVKLDKTAKGVTPTTRIQHWTGNNDSLEKNQDKLKELTSTLS